jgi:hypothetical protein
MTARVVLVEVQHAHSDEKYSRGRHWELEWQGPAGTFRSGQWYGPIEVRRVAEECNPSDIEVRALP